MLNEKLRTQSQMNKFLRFKKTVQLFVGSLFLYSVYCDGVGGPVYDQDSSNSFGVALSTYLLIWKSPRDTAPAAAPPLELAV